ncbi:hypothetical protein E1292_13985 [Nonomuraea deserti]|uniref:Uncharacterized protein n=1 Tax=Nonomuraea deserti TaxID=1848322 RepID=A0A4R4VMW2_9ACTN|nr:hypothetical protein [Nonomuraea deserti]TDD07159.1 hypothetical protein E1292_13985 [Nonomuraea deserti]
MSSRKPPAGPFPYPTHSDWAEHLYEAIVNTCEADGLAPVPRRAVIEGLAPALGAGEAKRVVERRRDGRRVLRATAYHVEGRGTSHALLLLNAALHGAATLPWSLNDRTRSDWLHPTPDNFARLEELVAQERTVARAKADLGRAKAAQRGLAPTATAAEKDAAVAAIKSAEDDLARAQKELAARTHALGGRRPLPMVRAAMEDGISRAALASAQVPSDMAAAIQRYAVERLRARGRLRSYDLVESLVQEGQRDSTVVVLQQVPMVDRDGENFDAWRPFQVTGNNRCDCRLQIFGLEAEQLLTGVPQPHLLLPDETENRRLVLRGLGEILRRVSARLNAEYNDPERDPEGKAERAKRIAQVPARVVVGASTPERLEAALRDLNVHDHLRGQLVYGDGDRGLGLWSTLVKAYQGEGLLGEILTKEVTGGRITADALDESGIADALVGAAPLDPLAVLLSPGEEITQLTLRDMAIRCTTLLLFPPIPPRPEGLPARAHMPTGRYWPIVRKTLQEAPWSQQSGPKAKRRTEVWAAVVAQHFVYRGNLLAMDGAFSAGDVQFGAPPDPRSLSSLRAACREGDPAAWDTLVRRHLLSGLVNAPEPFVTSGQGSERSADRKGVRRTPTNAILALVRAFTSPPPGVTRELLLAFASSVLEAPEAVTGVGGMPPGTFWAPDAHGNPQEGVLADKAWYDSMFPKIAGDQGKPPRQTSPTSDDQLSDQPDELSDQPDETSKEVEEEVEEDAFTRMTRLRGELPGQLEQGREGVKTAVDDLGALVELIRDAVAARREAGAPEEPSQVQKAYVTELTAAKEQSARVASLLDDAIVAVMQL